MSIARDCDKLADVNTELLSKLALKTKEFENKNAERNRLSAAREEELQSTIDRNSRVFNLTEELLAFKKETIKRESSIADAERNQKSELIESANEITMLKRSIADAERCHKSELVESSNQIATLKTELDNQKQNVAELENTFANSVNLEKENKSLKIKLRWLEVFIVNVKLKYSLSRESLRGLDSTIGILRQSLGMLHQTCTAMVVESNYRECKLQQNYAKISQLTTDIQFVRSQNDVAQSCISPGDVLLTTYQNAIQELITARESLFHTFQCTSSIEIDNLRVRH